MEPINFGTPVVKRVNVNICGQVSSFYRKLCRYQVLYVVVYTIVSELREFNDKKKNTMDKMPNFVIIWPKSGSLMKYLVHRLLLTCSVV